MKLLRKVVSICDQRSTSCGSVWRNVFAVLNLDNARDFLATRNEAEKTAKAKERCRSQLFSIPREIVAAAEDLESPAGVRILECLAKFLVVAPAVCSSLSPQFARKQLRASAEMLETKTREVGGPPLVSAQKTRGEDVEQMVAIISGKIKPAITIIEHRSSHMLPETTNFVTAVGKLFFGEEPKCDQWRRASVFGVDLAPKFLQCVNREN